MSTKNKYAYECVFISPKMCKCFCAFVVKKKTDAVNKNYVCLAGSVSLLMQ